MSQARIDPARLWQDLMTMASLGSTPRGGCQRPALSDSDRDARNLFAHWCREAGLTIAVDPVGNMFARREGTEPGLDPVMMGSHLDTQMPGGRFDGILGVLAGLAAIRACDAAGLALRRPVEVVNWTNEEGARFFPGLMGSAVFSGSRALADALAVCDRDGRTVGAELARIGYAGTAPLGGRAVDSYLELHIEQGPELERAGTTIGAVTQSNYMSYSSAEFAGQNAHVSSMPMADRRNALLGAAKAVVAIDAVGMEWAPDGSASVTVLDCWPNNRINIPHRAALRFSIVHPTEHGFAAMTAQVNDALRSIAAQTGLELTMTDHVAREPFHFDTDLTELVVRASEQAGYTVRRMRTRPGHDAFNMTTVCPTQLIFVPCRGGLSHNEMEWCEPEHVAAGATVLLRTMVARAE